MTISAEQAQQADEAAHEARIALLTSITGTASDKETVDFIGPSGLRDLAEAYNLVIRGQK